MRASAFRRIDLANKQQSPMAMASDLQSLFILFLLTVINHHHLLLPAQGFLLKLTKDVETHQYTTELLVGTPKLPTKLVLDLSGESLWLNCPQSRNLVSHGSLQCLMAKSPRTAQSPTPTCGIHQHNPITGESNFGDLAEDIVAVDAVSTVDRRFLFSCSPAYLLKGLVNGAKGVLGFGRSKIAFQFQMVNNFDLPRKFTLCLSSSDGFIISGTDIAKSLSYTPLIHRGTGGGYYVNVNSIKINGRRLVVGGEPIGGVEISSTVPYTVMKSPLYRIFKKAFVTAASAMNMTVVSPPVAPFGVCFTAGSSQATVPEIELVLQSQLVKWRIQGLVELNDSVMCLGFVDGGFGMNMAGSMILGGYQLEDHMLELDLGRGMMGFTASSLLKEGESCSNIRASFSTSL